MKDNFCEYCRELIERGSPSCQRKKFCSESHRQMHNRRSKGLSHRQTKRLGNFSVNNEWLYIARACKRAGSVQLMSQHTVASLRQLVDIISKQPKGNMEINQVRPVNESDKIELFHSLNIFYGERAQNKKRLVIAALEKLVVLLIDRNSKVSGVSLKISVIKHIKAVEEVFG